MLFSARTQSLQSCKYLCRDLQCFTTPSIWERLEIIMSSSRVDCHDQASERSVNSMNIQGKFYMDHLTGHPHIAIDTDDHQCLTPLSHQLEIPVKPPKKCPISDLLLHFFLENILCRIESGSHPLRSTLKIPVQPDTLYRSGSFCPQAQARGYHLLRPAALLLISRHQTGYRGLLYFFYKMNRTPCGTQRIQFSGTS